MTLLLCAAGLVALVFGAELITRYGAALAARIGVPPIVVGLTVVAVGTSAPELAIGIEAVKQGADTLTIGNIAGANTLNLLFALGVSALILPLPFRMQTLRFELPSMIVAALAMLAVAWDGVITHWEAGLLVTAGLCYTAVIVVLARRERQAILAEFAQEYGEPKAAQSGWLELLKTFGALVLGLVIILFGADWLVEGASRLARAWGVSEAFIGLTIVAIGTSAPELTTTIISTLRNERDIAIGNLLGSSVYNIVFILGLITLSSDQGVAVSRELVTINIPVMVAAAIVCAPAFMTGRELSRAEGGCFAAAYLGYLAFMIATSG